ncbi:T9SS type A sorting domain-containing protein [uncultured Winogradskyella sp.]|uniref:T9SS type A sorting domain-containing protein n=1 Tax=uncultured Winogradskyella sp. TaxID=395353 RepID=UPI0030EBCA48
MKNLTKILLTVIVFFSLQIINAQISFFESVVDSTAYNISDAIAVDLDGDGDQDLVYESNPFSWSKNTDGEGTMGDVQIIDDNRSINKLKFGDIDNDGDFDLIVLGYNIAANTIDLGWYENLDGFGNFSSIQIIANANFSDLDINDLDGDSFVDIVITSEYDGKIAWYKNVGSGLFGAEQLITYASVSSTYYFLSVATGDLDNDNDIDIVYVPYGSINSAIYWVENSDGNGAFTTTNLIGGNSAIGTYDINLVDFDQDGVVDLYTENYYYKNNGLGVFNFEDTFNTAYDNISNGKAIDVDGDTDMDMVFFVDNYDSWHSNDGVLIWFENTDGLGTFSEEQIIKDVNFTGADVINNAIGYAKFNIADLNGDGYQDLVCLNVDGYEVSWFENENDSDIFGASNEIINTIKGINDFHSADIDSDGDEDIIFISGSNDTVGWYENLDGNGAFGEQQIISVEGNTFSTLKIADIDSNGSLDIVVSSSRDDTIWIYKNSNGLGDFILHQSVINSSESSRGMKLFDVDNDNHIDIVMLENYGDKMVWFKNTDGQGNYSAEQVITEDIDDLDDYNFSDLDNDGDLDIVINFPFSWLENLGYNGNFNPPQIIETPETIDRLKTFDVDSDGDNDILVKFSPGLGWFENTNSQGNFGIYHIIYGASYSDLELIMDIDNDGDLDVVYQKYLGDITEREINWLNNNQGNFSFPILLDETDRVSVFAAGDLDGNDKNDLLYATSESSNSTGKIGWYRNLGILENQITGSITYDFNDNGCDVNDILVGNTLVASYINGFYFATYSQPNGTFELDVSQGVLYTSVTTNSNFTAAPNFFISDFENTGEVDNTAHFCLTAVSSINDFSIGIYPSQNDPRPDFNTVYQLVYSNIGATQLSGSLSFQFDDSKLNFLNASETVTSQTTNTLTFDFADLNPFETRTIDLEFNVFTSPTTNIGDELIAIATINPISGDETEEDNVFTLEQTVIGSYDPNDITVLEGDQILIEDADKYLHYLIRFQNTGTASAINVNVEHVLDDKLDWTTMQLESFSHTGRVEIFNETEVSFIFDNINLADSTNDETNSHGFIAFKIKPKSDVEVGDIISGLADIFFDFNPAITTNTVSTEFVEPLSVDEFSGQSIQLFPNPATDKLEIISNTIINKLSVNDINGRQFRDIKISSLDYSLDVSGLSTGVYFLEIHSGGKKSTKKFIKN